MFRSILLEPELRPSKPPCHTPISKTVSPLQKTDSGDEHHEEHTQQNSIVSPRYSSSASKTPSTDTSSGLPYLPEHIDRHAEKLEVQLSAQAKEIIDLRIKVAVLETRLEYSAKSESCASKSLGLLVDKLNWNGCSSHSSCSLESKACQFSDVRTTCNNQEQSDEVSNDRAVKELEREVELLRREKRALSKELRRKDRMCRIEHDLDDEIDCGTPGHDLLELTGTRGSTVGTPSIKQESQQQESFTSTTTMNTLSTIPNSPGLPPVISSTEAKPDCSIEDVGMVSLEDVLGEDDDDNDRLRDTQASEEQRLAVEKFMTAPAMTPGVVQTGIETQGAFRGNTYNLTSDKPKKDGLVDNWGQGSFRQYVTSDYDHSAHTSFARQDSSFSTQSFHQTSRNSIWSSREEREDAIQLHRDLNGQHAPKSFVEFFRYGITFKPSETDSNYQRTIHMGNLPKDIHLKEVLTKVRGGQVVSAVICDTLKLTGGMSVIIQFVHEASAEEYVQFTADHPITFACLAKNDIGSIRAEIQTMTAEVTLLHTPTWPLSVPSRKRIHEHQQTRCLMIPNFPDTLSLENLVRVISRNNGHRAASLLHLSLDGFDSLHLEFSSIDAAGSAFGLLMNRSLYEACRVMFADDPCNEPLEDRLLSTEKQQKRVSIQSDITSIKGRGPRFECGDCEMDFPSNNHLYAHMRSDHDSRDLIGYGQSFSTSNSFSSISTDISRGQSSESHSEVRAVPHYLHKRRDATAAADIDIPSFSGAGIKSSSWADEVIDDVELSDTSTVSRQEQLMTGPAPMKSASDIVAEEYQKAENVAYDKLSDEIETLMHKDINKAMARSGDHNGRDNKIIIGLAESSYAATSSLDSHAQGDRCSSSETQRHLRDVSSGKDSKERNMVNNCEVVEPSYTKQSKVLGDIPQTESSGKIVFSSAKKDVFKTFDAAKSASSILGDNHQIISQQSPFLHTILLNSTCFSVHASQKPSSAPSEVESCSPISPPSITQPNGQKYPIRQIFMIQNPSIYEYLSSTSPLPTSASEQHDVGKVIGKERRMESCTGMNPEEIILDSDLD